jgi:hypothetical protein
MIKNKKLAQTVISHVMNAMDLIIDLAKNALRNVLSKQKNLMLIQAILKNLTTQ